MNITAVRGLISFEFVDPVRVQHDRIAGFKLKFADLKRSIVHHAKQRTGTGNDTSRLPVRSDENRVGGTGSCPSKHACLFIVDHVDRRKELTIGERCANQTVVDASEFGRRVHGALGGCGRVSFEKPPADEVREHVGDQVVSGRIAQEDGNVRIVESNRLVQISAHLGGISRVRSHAIGHHRRRSLKSLLQTTGAAKLILQVDQSGAVDVVIAVGLGIYGGAMQVGAHIACRGGAVDYQMRVRSIHETRYVEGLVSCASILASDCFSEVGKADLSDVVLRCGRLEFGARSRSLTRGKRSHQAVAHLTAIPELIMLSTRSGCSIPLSCSR